MGSQPSKATPAMSSRWSALPPELADLVLRRLPSLADRSRFASVCRHWLHVATRYSAPCLPRALPWLYLPDGSFQSLPDGERHSFRRFRKHAWCSGSFGNWLLFQEEGRTCRHHFLTNPLTKATMRLPSYCNKPIYLNSDAAYSTRSRSIHFFIRKVIVCSSDLIAARVTYRFRRPDVVACCRPGMSSWSTGLCNGHVYDDMAFYKGKLYAVTIQGDLFAQELTDDCDTGEPRVSRNIEQVIRATPPLEAARRCYLVISHTLKLLMVRWTPPRGSTKEMKLKVFEADLEMSQWLEVKSLDDQVLFVSSTCSKGISASDHGDYVQGNKIYFVDDGLGQIEFSDLVQIFSGGPTINPRTCGVYDMSSDTIHSISLGELHISDRTKASWFFP
ncbi:uncharacterized protein LOC133886480 [Phragmites australis]|uniref:uncharacterized protein LOC133886480 n=1 Tax=Phragmites australis TaxID=29695 RepID=UPI002D782ABB|nr:uncharacterized protein LOC133886480 [Phragmites australis]